MPTARPLGTANVSGGQATVSTAALAMGKHTIEADYSGDGTFITSLWTDEAERGKAVSTVALTSSLNPAPYGQPVTVTATVTNSDGTTPTGPVVFAEGSTVYGTVSLSGGAAQIALPALIVGKHKITAQYGGDTSDAADKATLTETITGGPSTTTVTSSAQPSTYGGGTLHRRSQRSRRNTRRHGDLQEWRRGPGHGRAGGRPGCVCGEHPDRRLSHHQRGLQRQQHVRDQQRKRPADRRAGGHEYDARVLADPAPSSAKL